MTEKPHGERISVLETDFKHFKDRFDDTATKVDELHTFFTQAKGAKWLLLMLLGGLFFLVTKWSMLVSWVTTIFTIK